MKYKTLRISTILLACLIIFSLQELRAQNFSDKYIDKNIIRYGLIPDYPPLTYIDQDGIATGFYIELFSRIIREFGYEPEYVVAPFNEIYPQILSNEIDLFSTILRLESREDLFHWPEEATTTGWGQYFIKKGNTLNDIIDLQNSRVGLVKEEAQGQNFIQYMKQLDLNVQVVIYDSFESMINAVLEEEVEGGVAHNTVLLGDNRIKPTGIVFSPLSGYTTCSASNFRMIPLVDQFSARLTELKTDSDSYYWALYSKWYNQDGHTQNVLPRWLWIPAVILLFLVIILSFFSYILKTRVTVATNELNDLNDSLEYRIRKRTEELENATEQVIDAEKVTITMRLVAGIAHEINTPLGIAVTAVSHMESELSKLRESYKSNNLSMEKFEAFMTESQDVLNMTSKNLNRSAKLINNFRNVTSDQAIKEKRKIELASYIQEILSSIQPQFKHTEHKIHLNLKTCTINTYPDILIHILLNLLMNSLRHGFRDIQAGHIYITAMEKNGHVTLFHTDTGCGIPEKDMKLIYEPFYTTRRSEGNSGLGLNIVYNLISEKLKGTIDVSSRMGVYTKFKIEFDC